MIRVRSVLPLVIALLVLILIPVAYAQDVNWDVVLYTATVGPNGQNFLPITSATVNGQPLDVSKGEGVIGPWIYYNSSSYGFIVAQIPPTQPWNPTGAWYQWEPTLANTSRGTPQPTSNEWVFTEVDTFTYEYDLTFYKVWVQDWNATLTRTLQLHEQCGRWPCHGYVPIAQCTPANRCYVRFTDLSDVMELTGTFPIPTPPPYTAEAPSSSLYRCGSKRQACFVDAKASIDDLMKDHLENFLDK